MRARRLAKVLAPMVVGLLALAAYVQTLLPGVGGGDVARFQYVAQIWGIPHRFGYPLYIVVSRLFGYLPVEGPLGAPGQAIAYRVNLMSAVFGALAAVTVYLLVVRLAGDGLAAASAALSFAFSEEFWRQAVVAEVYTLNAFLVGAVLLALLAWHQNGKGWLLWAGLGLYALSFGNHMTVVTMVPAVAFVIIATDYRVLLNPGKVAAMAGLALLGAMQYLYVIFRAQQQPLLNELGPFSWQGWLRWMTRSRFEGQFFGYSLGEQVDRFRIYLELLEAQFFRWGYVLGWIGVWELLKDRTKGFVFLALAALGSYAFGINYGGGTFDIYLIPSYLVFAVFLGCGLSALRRWLADGLRDRPRWLAAPLLAGLAATVLVMPLYPLWTHWAEVDQSDNVYFHDLAWDFVEHLESDFVLIESEAHYPDVEAIRYVAWVEKGWYSARTVTPGGIETWLGQRPVYAWADSAAYHARYVERPVPGLPGIVRLVERKEE